MIDKKIFLKTYTGKQKDIISHHILMQKIVFLS